MEERIWVSRLRWRRRGAWMWPAFVAFTILDGVLVHALPLSGDDTGLVPALLLAGFLNLLAVGVIAPMLGVVWRTRWRPDLPRIVAHDYVGTSLIAVVFAALLAGGLIHRPAAREQRAAFRAQADAVRRYVLRWAPPPYRANLDRADTVRLEAHQYRTCVPGTDPARWLCLLVNTDQSPPGLRRDPNREPNARFVRPGAYRP